MDLTFPVSLIQKLNGVLNYYTEIYEGKENRIYDETLNQLSERINIDKSDLKSFLEKPDKDDLTQHEREVVNEFLIIFYSNILKDPDLKAQLIATKIRSFELGFEDIEESIKSLESRGREKEAKENVSYDQCIRLVLKELTEEIKTSIGFYIPISLVESELYFPKVSNKSSKNEYILAEQAIMDHDHLIVLGEPGSGKSSMLNQLAIHIIKKLHKVPIIINAKFWGFSFNSISKAIRYILDPYLPNIDMDIITNDLNNNKYIILIDGYDEIREGKEYFESEIISLARNRNNVKIILTSRKNSYHGELPNLKVFKMDKLSDDQIDEYAKNVIHFEHFSHYLYKLDLLELARLPLYLNMLCSYDANIEKIPKNKAKLHNWFAIYLLEEKLFKRMKPKYSLQLKMQFLSKFAEKKTKDPLYDDYIQCLNEMKSIDNASIFMQEILESGILKGSLSYFDFIHPTFREFFYSRLISSYETANIILFLKDHHDDDGYLDIILFLAGMQKETEKQKEILDFLENSNFPLYIKCLEARYTIQESTNDYLKFEYNYLYQLQRSYNSLLNNFFSNIKFRFYPYSYFPPDMVDPAKKLNVQVVGYVDVPKKKITYGYKIAKIEDNQMPLIILNKLFLYKFEDGTPFYRSTHIPGLDLDSAREIAIDDIRRELKRIIGKRALIHPRDALELYCEEVVADILAIRIIGTSLKPLCRSKNVILDAKKYYDTIDSKKSELCASSKINADLSVDIQSILARLDYLIKNDISLKEKVLPPYLPKLGDEMEKQFVLRLEKMYSVLPKVYSKIAQYNFPELQKYMRYINIYPFRCNIRYRYGIDFTKKGFILDPLGEASVYFEPVPNEENIAAIVKKANPEIDEEERLKLRMEYTNALKSLGRHSKNNYFNIFITSPATICNNLALTTAIYELIVEDFEWFLNKWS